ncbi:MAG TPA: RDD family protein [Rhabdochlamydiaceae bacterium]|nr:RDD family protein [Rhabdochlamydiaceae bacterium]
MFLSLRRSLARIFDYGLFYCSAILLSLMAPVEVNENFYFYFALAVPLFWAPIEAFLLTKWSTTLGKKLFGISVPGLTSKESLKRAFFFGKRPGVVIFKKITYWRYVIALMIACSAGSGLFYGKDISEAAVHYEQQVAGSGWVEYISENGKFSVHFPKNPEVASKTVEVPNGDPIELSEFKAEKDAAFSVSYLDLPKKWKIFSSNTLLKGAMKVVTEHMPGTQLLDKTIVKHKNHPAMDFRMKEGENEIEGRLILVGNTLYRLMVVYYPDTPRDQQHQTFVNSFHLKTIEKALIN